jgi:hypothetical protein
VGRSLEDLEGDLVIARGALARTQQKIDALENAATLPDPGMFSGTRRKPNAKADARRFASYDREAKLYAEHIANRTRVEQLERVIASAAKTVAVPFTPDDLAAARVIRTDLGWHRVVRVNAKSVSVDTGYSWVDRIPLEKVLEVR